MINFLKKNWDFLLVGLLASISVSGSVVYYAYNLNKYGAGVAFLLSLVIFIILIKTLKDNHANRSLELPETEITSKSSIFGKLLALSYLIVYAFSFYLLLGARTGEAIISPWQKVSAIFFLLYFLLFIILFFIIRSIKYSLFFITLQYLLTFSVAIVVYKIGYGFDPFIHEATMNRINEKGVVEPKTFYYIGQYSLIVILHKITGISISMLNKFGVPIFASLVLPAFFYRFTNNWFKNKRINTLAILTLLILPFSIFILTVPQNLAFIFLIITIFLLLKAPNVPELFISYLTALCTFFIHPLAGIPAILFSLSTTFYLIHSGKLKLDFLNILKNKKIKNLFYTFIFLLNALLLPIIFYLLGGRKLQFEPSSLLEGPPSFLVPGRENIILNFIYLLGNNYFLIILALLLVGLIISYKNINRCHILVINFLFFTGLMASFLLTKIFIPFDYLIGYEEGNYTDRILILSIIFALPFIFIALRKLLELILNQSHIIKYSLLVFLCALLTASLYLSYPRLDSYHNSHGYCISQSDIKAVNYIEESSKNDYIVLANQQVSVAALREVGFKKYYKDDIFFYPIPTGGKLYQYYLDMVYEKPSKETIKKALDLTGASKGYFVLNDYWWASEKLLEEAKMEADDWKSLDNGKIYIFEYKK